VPGDDNLYGILRAAFAHRLDAPFLCPPGEPSRTYRDIDNLSAHYAGLLHELGLQCGDRAVFQVEKSPEAIALYLACLRTGVVCVPLNTAYTAGELTHFLSDARPAMFVCRPDTAMELRRVAERAGVQYLLTLDAAGAGSLASRAAGAQPLAELVARDLDDVAAILYTSGTTGRSKGAMLTIGNLASNARALVQIWGWRDDDVLLHALPVFHAHGLFVAMHCAMLGASPVLFHRRFDTAAVRAALPAASVMMGVPTFYTRLLADPEFGSADCAQMRLFISGSAPLLTATFETFAERTGHRILERYGMTEAGMITSNPLAGERAPGTVGYPLPGVELRVTAADGSRAAPGDVGSVEIRGPNLFAGYWQMPEQTAAEFTADGFFRTGDLGQLAPDGRLTLVGRARELIISGGYNVYPKEIEARLDALPGVLESAVVGVPHADLGEAPVAVIVPDGAAPAEQTLFDALRPELARFKQPRRIFFVAELPRNTMGKVEKRRLEERYRDCLR
jgi:malonyl-CoA/methylmalonyl-CoA synthetase